MTDSDEALVVRSRNGERPAFEELVHRTGRLETDAAGQAQVGFAGGVGELLSVCRAGENRPQGRTTSKTLVHCQRLDLERVAWPDRYSEMAMSADAYMLIPEYRSEHATLKLSVDNAPGLTA